MPVIRATAFAVVASLLSSLALAAEKPFTGVFSGYGRACFGGLFVRTKTIEWNSPFSVCKPTQYDVLEKNAEGEKERIVFQLRKHFKRCGLAVIEIENAQTEDDRWDVTGYQTLESYQKRHEPEWADSVLDDRMTFYCSMFRL
ncbi:MAG: hypothetical protein LBP86_05705 [Azoarcus sp.]|jgi:hypothetical protein|nr:hypothetical protein [Azoarcus sp.]